MQQTTNKGILTKAEKNQIRNRKNNCIKRKLRFHKRKQYCSDCFIVNDKGYLVRSKVWECSCRKMTNNIPSKICQVQPIQVISEPIIVRPKTPINSSVDDLSKFDYVNLFGELRCSNKNVNDKLVFEVPLPGNTVLETNTNLLIAELTVLQKKKQQLEKDLKDNFSK